MNQSVKKKLDPVATRTSILEAAFACFSARGFSGTSIGEIAEACQVPKSLVLYHYGNKEQLWQACVQQRAAPMIWLIDRFLNEGGSVAELLEARVRLHETNPALARMLAWASLDPVPVPTFIEERRERLLERFSAQGSVEQILLALATIDGWYLYRNLYQKFAGETVVNSVSEDTVLKQALALVTRT